MWFTRKVGVLALMLLLGLAAGPARAIDVRFDVGAAQATLEALGEAQLTEERASQVASLPGNAALIAKAGSFDSDATSTGFVRELQAVARGEDLSATRPFGLARVRRDGDDLRALLQTLQRKGVEIARKVTARTGLYGADASTLDVTVVVVLGGTSDGWTTDELEPCSDRRPFFLALQYFASDLEGLELLLSHELYHVVQSEMQARSSRVATMPDAADVRAVGLLRSLVDEGSASLVGDATTWSNGGSYVSWYREKFERNLGRLQSIATLYETLLLRLLTDPSFSADDAYMLTFSGAWDSNAYFLGYQMARTLEGARGREGLAKLVFDSNPAAFVQAYLEADPAATFGDSTLRFSQEFRRQIHRLARSNGFSDNPR